VEPENCGSGGISSATAAGGKPSRQSSGRRLEKPRDARQADAGM